MTRSAKSETGNIIALADAYLAKLKTWRADWCIDPESWGLTDRITATKGYKLLGLTTLGEQLADAGEALGIDTTQLRKTRPIRPMGNPEVVPVASPDDLALVVERIRSRALGLVQTAPGRGATDKKDQAKPKRRGRPSDSGDTDSKLDAAIRLEWQKGYKSGKYITKADLAENLPDRLKRRVPTDQIPSDAYIKTAIERDRKRHPRKTTSQSP